MSLNRCFVSHCVTNMSLAGCLARRHIHSLMSTKMMHLQPLTGRLVAQEPFRRIAPNRLKTRAADAKSEQAVALEQDQLPPNLAAEVQQAYKAGFSAGYAAGAKVQVKVDLDLSRSRLHGANTSTSSNGGNQQAAQAPPAAAAGPAAGPAAAATARQHPTASDSIGRSVAKGFIWRLFSTAATISIALLVLHDVIKVDDALKIGGLEFLAKFVLYFLHERLWAAITWL